jgi:hypothetical protein
MTPINKNIFTALALLALQTTHLSAAARMTLGLYRYDRTSISQLSAEDREALFAEAEKISEEFRALTPAERLQLTPKQIDTLFLAHEKAEWKKEMGVSFDEIDLETHIFRREDSAGVKYSKCCTSVSRETASGKLYGYITSCVGLTIRPGSGFVVKKLSEQEASALFQQFEAEYATQESLKEEQ